MFSATLPLHEVYISVYFFGMGHGALRFLFGSATMILASPPFLFLRLRPLSGPEAVQILFTFTLDPTTAITAGVASWRGVAYLSLAVSNYIATDKHVQ